MKKTLVVLLILAVAGGVFAQEWSVSGNVKLGTDITFGKPVEVGPTGDDDMAQGEVSVEYSNEGFHAGINFGVYFSDPSADPEATIGVSAGYDGENFSVNAGIDYIMEPTMAWAAGLDVISSLWGKWFLFEKQLELAVAYKGPETIYWRVSDMLHETHAFTWYDWVTGTWEDGDAGTDWDNLDGNNGIQINWSPSFVEGLSIGFMFPVFGLDPFNSWTFEETFGAFVAGAKFEQDAWAVSLMYTNDGFFTTDGFVSAPWGTGKAFLLAGSLDIAEGTHGIGLEVLLGNLQKGANAFLSAAACYNLSLDKFGAGLTVKLLDLYLQGGSAGGRLTLDAYGQYEIMEDTLLLKLDIGLPIEFGGGVGLTFTPAVYYNPDASGISDDPDHALYLKCAMGWDDFKGDFGATLTIGYRWAF